MDTENGIANGTPTVTSSDKIILMRRQEKRSTSLFLHRHIANDSIDKSLKLVESRFKLEPKGKIPKLSNEGIAANSFFLEKIFII
jgi:hypothetical protein